MVNKCEKCINYGVHSAECETCDKEFSNYIEVPAQIISEDIEYEEEILILQEPETIVELTDLSELDNPWENPTPAPASAVMKIEYPEISTEPKPGIPIPPAIESKLYLDAHQQQTAPTGAVRNNLGKLRYDLLPATPLEEIVEIFTYGAQKYEDRNWEKGFNWTSVYASAMRHIQAWRQGEDIDPESGFSHLAHAAVNLLFLMEFAHTHPELDDRKTK